MFRRARRRPPNARRLHPTQPHNARSLGREVEVAYPFHPLFRQPAIVVTDQLHNGDRYLTLRSGDSRSFLVPAWMVEPAAASIRIVDVPRLPVARGARQLGWSDVEVIDDDLGRSGAGGRRPGFEKLLAAICEGRVGAVLSLEASRLARNGRDWHTLLEFCGLVGALIIDEDGIYDVASPNDRLLLGMKGTMSEMELSVFRQRSIEAMKQKARRGELFLTVAVGYVKASGDRIEKDADRRLQEAIALVFRKFAELQTIRQVLVWCRQEKIFLPAPGEGTTADRIIWRLPVYPTVHHMLTNPVYAGAYAFGRRTARVTIENRAQARG